MKHHLVGADQRICPHPMFDESPKLSQTVNFLFLLQRCHTSLNSLLNNSLSGVNKVALVATNADFNEILTQNSRKDATK